MKIIIELEDIDFDHLYDIVINSMNLSKEIKEGLNSEKLLKVWEFLDDDIKSEAVRWGLQDTCVRDSIYEYLQYHSNSQNLHDLLK